jgi:uncharacterized protein (DUF1778 family)
VARNKKAAIFVRCTEEEAKRIRRAAKSEQRTLSGFIMKAVMNRLEHREELLRGHKTANNQRLVPAPPA